MATKRTDLRLYDPAYWDGGATTHAAQGRCSRGCGRSAVYMIKVGRGWHARCEECAPKPKTIAQGRD